MPPSQTRTTLDTLEASLKRAKKCLKREIKHVRRSTARTVFAGLGSEQREVIARAGIAIDSQISALSQEMKTALSAGGIESSLRRSKKHLKQVLKHIAGPSVQATFSTLRAEQHQAMSEAGAAIRRQIEALRTHVEAALQPEGPDIPAKANLRSIAAKRHGPAVLSPPAKEAPTPTPRAL